MKDISQKNVLLSFLKIGAVGFGGGAALIPVIESELVENNKWIDKNSF
ncbi:MAG: chromate transporter, partial [Defluviitaleaceae bacterium]|nr:chromate transporter [Defluviitaleaceae bacterium]